MSTRFPGVHSVQLYERDTELITSVGGMFAASLSFGDSAIVAATAEHCEQFARELERLGIDVEGCLRQQRYMALDAANVRSSIMRRGQPNRELFEVNFGSVLEQVRQRALNQNRGLTVYDECVALLWHEGRKQAALTLERFWQDVFRDDHPLHLHCAYPSAVFADGAEICLVQDLHSHVFQHSPSERSAA